MTLGIALSFRYSLPGKRAAWIKAHVARIPWYKSFMHMAPGEPLYHHNTFLLSLEVHFSNVIHLPMRLGHR
jgi:hypothetical protein